MERRCFLRLIAGAGLASALPPSMVFPFRKIFLPPAAVPVRLDFAKLLAPGLHQIFIEQLRPTTFFVPPELKEVAEEILYKTRYRSYKGVN